MLYLNMPYILKEFIYLFVFVLKDGRIPESIGFYFRGWIRPSKGYIKKITKKQQHSQEGMQPEHRN